MPTRREFLAALGAAPAAAGADRDRPNIIFLLTDDQRWDSLSCMGNPVIRTPNIDKLSEHGVHFRRHFVTTAICMTSRASIFSGLYARTHGINDFQKPFTPEQYSRIYPELMRAAGYYTGFIGKWGVGNRMPEDRFDYWRGFPGQGHYYQKRDGQFVHLTELMGDQSLEFLGGVTKGKPFCLSVSFKAPHVQDEDPRQFLYDPKHRYLYHDDRIPIPRTADPRYIAMLPPEVQRSEGRRRWAVRFGTPELYQESVRSYYRLITEVDMVVGRLVADLKKRGVWENTVIVYSGDNGFYLGEHGLAGKWLMHEESIRTPMIIHDPRLPAAAQGKKLEHMSLNIDIAPTLLSIAGLNAPQMQGRDLYPLIQGQTGDWRHEFFYEHTFTNGWIPQTEGIRSETWKYTRYTDTDPTFEELFDLSADPLEEHNLAADPARKSQLEQMRARWQRWRESFQMARAGSSWSEPS